MCVCVRGLNGMRWKGGGGHHTFYYQRGHIPWVITIPIYIYIYSIYIYICILYTYIFYIIPVYLNIKFGDKYATKREY